VLKLKTNEAIYRSPKWLRNFLDFEIASGKDIKGEPSLKMKSKLAQEKAEKERREREARAERERREREARAERERREREKEFNDVLGNVIAFIQTNYRDCYISVPQHNFLKIEHDSLHISHVNLSFEITLDNRIKWPKFEIHIKYGKKDYNYDVSGLNYTNFKLFLLNTVYPFFQSGKAKKKDSGYKHDDGQREYKQQTKRAERPNQQTEKDPVQNRLRRLALLRQTLEGYQATLAKTKKGTREYETLSNEIETIKGRIRAMENAKNESYNHVMSYQLFEKTYNPAEGDYVQIEHPDSPGSLVPVKILKVYRNGSYNVDYNVEGSLCNGKGTGNIKNFQIMGPYKPLKSPVGTGFISANTNMSIRQVHQVSNDMYL
jgi:hypothetical protein